MPPTQLKENDPPVRLRFLKNTTFQFRQYAAGERPVQWFFPREANRLIRNKIAEIDPDAETYEQVVAREAEEGPSEPPPQRTGNPHGSLFVGKPDPDDEEAPQPLASTPSTLVNGQGGAQAGGRSAPARRATDTSKGV